jgi:hypothetical protein
LLLGFFAKAVLEARRVAFVDDQQRVLREYSAPSLTRLEWNARRCHQDREHAPGLIRNRALEVARSGSTHFGDVAPDRSGATSMRRDYSTQYVSVSTPNPFTVSTKNARSCELHGSYE